MLLADEFFLLVLDDRTGRLRLGPRASGLGVAAALLAELVAGGHLRVLDDQLVVIPVGWPVDVLQRAVLGQLMAEAAQHSVRDWLQFFADSAVGSVADRLRAQGVVRVDVGRGLWRRRVVYAPVDVNTAAWPWARLSVKNRRCERLGWSDVFLAGLASATGLERQILDGEPTRVRVRWGRVVDTELWWPLRELVAQVRAVVADSVLTAH